jgi:rhodanese-related sulfurtransferase
VNATPRPRSAVRDAALLLLIAFLPASLTLGLHPKRPAFAWTRPAAEQVDLDEALRWGPSVLWVDARNADSFDRQHVPGAILLNEDSWQELIPEFLAAWKPGTRVVIYCDSQKCHASEEVAVRLARELKISNVYVLKGGWDSWLHSPRK